MEPGPSFMPPPLNHAPTPAAFGLPQVVSMRRQGGRGCGGHRLAGWHG